MKLCLLSVSESDKPDPFVSEFDQRIKPTVKLPTKVLSVNRFECWFIVVNLSRKMRFLTKRILLTFFYWFSETCIIENNFPWKDFHQKWQKYTLELGFFFQCFNENFDSRKPFIIWLNELLWPKWAWKNSNSSRNRGIGKWTEDPKLEQVVFAFFLAILPRCL